MKPTIKEIQNAWEMYEEIFEEVDPDISTERLMSLIRNYFENKIDDGDIAEAMSPKNYSESKYIK